MEKQHPVTSKSGSMKNIYLAVFGTLAVLTLITVGVSYLHLPRPQAIAVGLCIAAIKVSLIAAFFMHLKSEKKLIHSLFYTAFIFVIFLLVMVLMDLARTSS
jgi:cytochrome c oxidase subunit 4